MVCRLPSAIDSDNYRAIARSVFCHPVGRYHDIQQRHMVTVWNRNRIGRFADHPHLSVRRPDEASDDDRNIGLMDVLGQPLLDFTCQLCWRLTSRRDVLDQRGGDAAIRSDSNSAFTQIRVAIDKDAQRVPDPMR